MHLVNRAIDRWSPFVQVLKGSSESLASISRRTASVLSNIWMERRARDPESSNSTIRGQHPRAVTNSGEFVISDMWGSVSISKDKIRFAISSDAYAVWWGRIGKYRGHRRLALAPELGALHGSVRI